MVRNQSIRDLTETEIDLNVYLKFTSSIFKISIGSLRLKS